MGKYVPYNIWFMVFISAQGYGIENNLIYQDNQSAMRMKKNGHNSCTENSRHIHIIYFFVKDRIDKVKMKVKYCPTHLMLADFFTKQLIGKTFRKSKSVIMGYISIFEIDPTLLQSIKERVGIRIESHWMQNLYNLILCVLVFFTRVRSYYGAHFLFMPTR